MAEAVGPTPTSLRTIAIFSMVSTDCLLLAVAQYPLDVGLLESIIFIVVEDSGASAGPGAVPRV